MVNSVDSSNVPLSTLAKATSKTDNAPSRTKFNRLAPWMHLPGQKLGIGPKLVCLVTSFQGGTRTGLKIIAGVCMSTLEHGVFMAR